MAKNDREPENGRSGGNEPSPLYDPFEQLMRLERSPLTRPWDEDHAEAGHGRFRDAAE